MDINDWLEEINLLWCWKQLSVEQTEILKTCTNVFIIANTINVCEIVLSYIHEF